MAGKGKKKKAKAVKNGEKKKTGRRTRKGRAKSSRNAVDIFTEAAMENAYSTCHSVQDLLFRRGFPWPEAQKTKKKKGKK